MQQRANDIDQRAEEEWRRLSRKKTFAKVAKGRSENPASAPSGGKLPGPVRENPNKPDDPYQRLLKMKPGEITEPISYQSRYFILRRGEDVPKTFEDAKKELEVSLRNRKAYAAAAELARKIDDALKADKGRRRRSPSSSPSQANMAPAEMVKETGYVKARRRYRRASASRRSSRRASSRSNRPATSAKRRPIQNGFAVPMLVDRKRAARDADFDEVKAQIIELLSSKRPVPRSSRSQRRSPPVPQMHPPARCRRDGSRIKAKDQKNFVLGSPLGEGVPRRGRARSSRTRSTQ